MYEMYEKICGRKYVLIFSRISHLLDFNWRPVKGKAVFYASSPGGEVGEGGGGGEVRVRLFNSAHQN